MPKKNNGCEFYRYGHRGAKDVISSQRKHLKKLTAAKNSDKSPARTRKWQLLFGCLVFAVALWLFRLGSAFGRSFPGRPRY